MAPAREIEPYFSAAIKALASFGSPVSQNLPLPPLTSFCHLVTVTRPLNMQDATATAAHDLSAADSPAVESPDTPVNTHDSAKIIIETDLDSPDRFPDEPVLHYVKHDDLSSRPPLAIPIDTGVFPAVWLIQFALFIVWISSPQPLSSQRRHRRQPATCWRMSPWRRR